MAVFRGLIGDFFCGNPSARSKLARPSRHLMAASHCTCQLNCMEQLSQEEILFRRNAIGIFKTRSQLTSFLASTLIDQASAFGVPHLSFHINNKKVCQGAFCFVHNITRRKTDSIRRELHKIGLAQLAHKRDMLLMEPRHESSKHTNHPHSPMKFEEIVGWLSMWVEMKRVYKNDDGVSCLQDGFTWQSVYQEFKEAIGHSYTPPSESSFLRAKDYLLAQHKVAILRPQDHPFCSMCVQYYQSLQDTSKNPHVSMHRLIIVIVDFPPFNALNFSNRR